MGFLELDDIGLVPLSSYFSGTGKRKGQRPTLSLGASDFGANLDCYHDGLGLLRERRYNLFMPIYEYVCNDCETRYERIVLSSKTEIQCPKCASKRHTLQLSVFNAGKSSNGSSSLSESSPSGCRCTPNSCGCN